MTWVEALIDLLVARGVGIAAQTLFIGPAVALPDTDVAITTFYETPGISGFQGRASYGTDAGRVHNQPRRANLELPRAQALTRAGTRDDAYAMAAAIYELFEAITNDQVSGMPFLKVRALQRPFDMPIEAGRVRVACNYEALVRP